MTFTYTPTDPTATDAGKVRLLYGDTDSAKALLQDEEIAYFLTLTGSVDPDTGRYTDAQIRLGAAHSADAAAAKCWFLADKSIGPTRIALNQRREALIQTADRLWGESGGRSVGGAPKALCGGISRSEDAGLISSDAKTPTFYNHMQEASPEPAVDNKGGGGTDPLLGGGP